jgi:putative tricarboxylic transport membrane protein
MPARATGQIAVAVGVLALAGIVAQQTTVIPVSPLYAKVGPTIFPWIVVAGLALLGLLLLIEALRGGWPTEDGEAQVAIDWAALGWVLAGLVGNVVLIGPLGFILASTLLFCCVARAFGSTQLPRDAAIAFVFSALTYVGFARVLGINIGAGLIERFL